MNLELWAVVMFLLSLLTEMLGVASRRGELMPNCMKARKHGSWCLANRELQAGHMAPDMRRGGSLCLFRLVMYTKQF